MLLSLPSAAGVWTAPLPRNAAEIQRLHSMKPLFLILLMLLHLMKRLMSKQGSIL